MATIKPFLVGALIGGSVVGGVMAYRKYKGLTSLLGAGSGDSSTGNKLKDAVGVHVRQIRRYAFASSQDISPIVGITHASYALILLDALEEIIGRDAIEKAGFNATKVRKFITELQDKHAEALKGCDKHLQKILEIERAEGMQIPGYVVAGAPRGA